MKNVENIMRSDFFEKTRINYFVVIFIPVVWRRIGSKKK